jgi:hypothetical protein
MADLIAAEVAKLSRLQTPTNAKHHRPWCRWREYLEPIGTDDLFLGRLPPEYRPILFGTVMNVRCFSNGSTKNLVIGTSFDLPSALIQTFRANLWPDPSSDDEGNKSQLL